MDTNIVIIACSIFKYELDHLKEQGKIKVPIIYLNSMLHMYPQKLQTLLDNKIKKYKDFKIILMYGDCHARMVDYQENSNILRTPGINCCEILLGTEKYRKVRRNGAFILLPEWADRWKEAFVDTMGFKTSKMAKPFMKEMHNKILYLDTGFKKKSNPVLNEVSEFLGLPLEVYNTSINELEKTINQLLAQAGKQNNLENGE